MNIYKNTHMQALNVRKALARILKMCLLNHYSNENATENVVKPMSIYERENYLDFSPFWIFAELLSQL